MPKETINCTHSLSASGQLRAYFIRAKLINRSVKGPTKQLRREEDGKRSKKGSLQTFQEIILDSEQYLLQLPVTDMFVFHLLVSYSVKSGRIESAEDFPAMIGDA